MRRELDVQTDAAGALKVPGLPAGRTVHVVVEWEESDAALGYPPGWAERVLGSIQDDSFVRPSQGELEQRRTFD